jgi:hypothetical protein
VDHVVDWQDFCADAIAADNRQLFEERYHEMSNLRLTHNNCNASKNATELFDWWRGLANNNNRFRPGAVPRIKAALQRLFLSHGVDWVAELA